MRSERETVFALLAVGSSGDPENRWSLSTQLERVFHFLDDNLSGIFEIQNLFIHHNKPGLVEYAVI